MFTCLWIYLSPYRAFIVSHIDLVARHDLMIKQKREKCGKRRGHTQKEWTRNNFSLEFLIFCFFFSRSLTLPLSLFSAHTKQSWNVNKYYELFYFWFLNEKQMRDIARRYIDTHRPTNDDWLNSLFIHFLLVRCLIDLKIANDDDSRAHEREEKKTQPIRYVVRLLLNWLG